MRFKRYQIDTINSARTIVLYHTINKYHQTFAPFFFKIELFNFVVVFEWLETFQTFYCGNPLDAYHQSMNDLPKDVVSVFRRLTRCKTWISFYFPDPNLGSTCSGKSEGKHTHILKLTKYYKEKQKIQFFSYCPNL